MRGLDPSSGNLSWSPDGRSIAFADGEIYVVNRDGSKLRRLTRFGAAGFVEGPAWSPSGMAIAFSGRRRCCGAEIFAIKRDGTRLRNLTRTSRAFEFRPTWSPDGRRIAFGRDSGPGDFYVMRADGRQMRNLSRSGNVHLYRNDAPLWSRDGKWIAFVQHVGEVPRLFLVSADGRKRVAVDQQADRWIDRYVWSPDGTTLAVGASDVSETGSTEGMYLFDLRSRTLTKVADCCANLEDWQPLPRSSIPVAKLP